jgi:hypothetical protein
LANCRGEAAISAVKRAVADSNPTVAEAAQESLDRLRGGKSIAGNKHPVGESA